MAQYVVMGKDELGQCFRAYGTPNLEKEYTYPTVNWNDELEVDMFYAWQCALEERLQEEWEKHFGPETRIFLERKFSDMTLAEIRMYNENDLW